MTAAQAAVWPDRLPLDPIPQETDAGWSVSGAAGSGMPQGMPVGAGMTAADFPPVTAPTVGAHASVVPGAGAYPQVSPKAAKHIAKEPKKRAGSIAGKLHRMVISRRLFGYLWLNLIVVATTFGLWIYRAAEKAGFALKKTKDISFVGKSLDTFGILFENRDGVLTVQPGESLEVFAIVMTVAVGFEILSVLRVLCLDRFPIRRRLKPLRDMAETAQTISNAHWNEEKLQNLTYAISHVDAESPSDHVRTNDRELTGMEKAVNDLIDRMRDAAREQTRFVSDASHELRTPIAVIKGYADMLDRWGKEDREILEEAITAIRSESDHMNTLVEQLLFLARGDAGRQKLTLGQMSLTSVMKEVHEESEMIDSKHAYELKLDGGEVMCYGDPAMLKQSIRILVDNAAKYTTVGDTITLRVGIDAQFRPFYSVQDNGVGMSSRDVEHIFERFYRSDTARNSKTGGTGLGLSIAKWIINRHHGTIMVQSRPEIGTRFTIFLNAREAEYNEAVVIGA